MTRNNLNEHIRWLISAQPSIPQNLLDLPAAQALTETDNLHPNDEGNFQVSDLSATSTTARALAPPLRPLQNTGHELAKRPSPFEMTDLSSRNAMSNDAAINTMKQRNVSLISIPDSDDGIEIMDMTESHDEVEPQPAMLPPKLIPRKRRSDEIESLVGSVSHRSSPKSSLRKYQYAPGSTELRDTTPLGPPPPYSTHPPTPMRPVGTIQGAVESTPAGDHSHISLSDDDELFNFSETAKKPTSRAPAPRLPVSAVEVPEVGAKAQEIEQQPAPVTKSHDSIHKTSNEVVNSPSATPSHAVEPAMRELLDRFYKLPAIKREALLDELASQQDKVSEQAANMIDSGLDDLDGNIMSELDRLEAVVGAIKTLIDKGPRMMDLSDRKDQAFARLKTAIKNRESIAQAKDENVAAKKELEAFQAQCITLVSCAETEITDACKRFDSLQSTVAVQATQIATPSQFNVSDPRSPGHVLQTQSANTHNHLTSLSNLDKPRTLMGPPKPPLTSSRKNTTSTSTYDIDDDEFMFDENELMEMSSDLGHSHSRTALREVSNNRQSPQRQITKTKPGNTIRTNDPQFAKSLGYPWSHDVMRVLREKFDLQGFRQGQLEAINATLEGRDTFVLMPTGGGKSLCYQLPSQIGTGKTHGVTVVISPLLSLMQDQVQGLRSHSIQAVLINGNTPLEDRKDIYAKLRRPDVHRFIQILYVTPEMLANSQAMTDVLDNLYSQKRLARLVIDEAHCVSQWGHDFRKDYKSIGSVRQKWKGVPVMALTATATENVKLDTIRNLSINGCEIITRSFNRPNLKYTILDKGRDVAASIAELIKTKHNNETGIIYCLSQKDCEKLAETLTKEHRIKAAPYHGGMEVATKTKAQLDWQANKQRVMVATIAFGMGIDKPDVRFVIHHALPKNLEGYYQETGRAGRDGRDSFCYLYYSGGDIARNRGMIERNKELGPEPRQRQHDLLKKMAHFCQNKIDCRRVQILGYFNESFDRQACAKHCDNCSSTEQYERRDFTALAQDAVNIVRLLQDERVTSFHCADVLIGKKTHKWKQESEHDKKRTAELNQHVRKGAADQKDARRLFNELVNQDALEEEHVENRSGHTNTYVRVGWKRIAGIQLDVKSEGDQQGASSTKRGAKVRRAAEAPMSTNISSPVQAAAFRRENVKDQRRRGDSFLMSDGDDDECFEPVSKPAAKKHAKAITSDGVLDDLDEAQRMFVSDFMQRAKALAQKISSKNSLRRSLFSDTIFREMAMNLVETPESMQQIEGVRPEQVDAYGAEFCKLMKECHAEIEEQNPEESNDPNKLIMVISSDDEDDAGGKDDEDVFSSMDEADFDDDPAQGTDDEVAAFNSRLAGTQSVGLHTQPKARPAKKKGRGNKQYKGTQTGSYTAKKPGRYYKKRTSKGSSTGTASRKAASNSFISAMPR